MVIGEIRLLAKKGGKSGDWTAWGGGTHPSGSRRSSRCWRPVLSQAWPPPSSACACAGAPTVSTRRKKG